MLYKIVTHQHGATLTYLNLTDAAALLKARDLRSRGVTMLIVGQHDGRVVQEAEAEAWIKDEDHEA